MTSLGNRGTAILTSSLKVTARENEKLMKNTSELKKNICQYIVRKAATRIPKAQPKEPKDVNLPMRFLMMENSAPKVMGMEFQKLMKL